MPHDITTLAQTDASMEALRASLKSVLETVTHLELRARRSLSGKDRVQAIIRCLAAALPALQQLTLTGANSEIGLLSFGTYCPGLSHVKLDARMVPLALVRTMDCLPNLRKVTISNSDTRLSPYHYADALLKYVVKAEIPLEVLDLEGRLSPVFMTILPNSGVWDRLPASLTDLSCSCEMFYCFYNIAAQEFMGRLRFLTLKDGPYLSDLLWMLKCSPQLEKLVVMTDYPPARPLNLTWRSVYKYGPSSMVATTITPEDVTRYKEQLQQGFQIVCECVSLRGPLDNIQKLLTWLTPQPAVTSLTMAKEQAGAKDVRRLADLAFPNLQHVKVV